MGLQLAMGAQALLIPSVPPPVVQMISPRHVLHDRAPSAFPGGATLFLADDEEDGGSGGLSLDGLIPSIDSLMPSSEPEPAAAPSSSSVGLPEKLMGDFGRLGSSITNLDIGKLANENGPGLQEKILSLGPLLQRSIEENGPGVQEKLANEVAPSFEQSIKSIASATQKGAVEVAGPALLQTAQQFAPIAQKAASVVGAGAKMGFSAAGELLGPAASDAVKSAGAGVSSLAGDAVGKLDLDLPEIPEVSSIGDTATKAFSDLSGKVLDELESKVDPSTRETLNEGKKTLEKTAEEGIRIASPFVEEGVRQGAPIVEKAGKAAAGALREQLKAVKVQLDAS